VGFLKAPLLTPSHLQTPNRTAGMTIASRTPEGMPSKCSLCGANVNIEFSSPANDVPCPSCGHLLWASDQMLQTITQRFENVLSTSHSEINTTSTFSDIGATSLEVVELVLDLEEEFEIDIPVPEADRIKNVGDIVRSILKHAQPK